MVEGKRGVICPQCGKRLSAPESYAGRSLKCPACEAKFQCVFDSGAVVPSAASAAPPVRGFRLIDVPDLHPKRSPLVEMARLGLGAVAALTGAVVALIAWAIISLMSGSVIGLVGVPLVGGTIGLGMRLGYGRFGDAAAGVIAGVIAIVSSVIGTVIISANGGTSRGLAICAGLSGALAFCIAFGHGFDGNDID